MGGVQKTELASLEHLRAEARCHSGNVGGGETFRRVTGAGFHPRSLWRGSIRR